MNFKKVDLRLIVSGKPGLKTLIASLPTLRLPLYCSRKPQGKGPSRDSHDSLAVNPHQTMLPPAMTSAAPATMLPSPGVSAKNNT